MSAPILLIIGGLYILLSLIFYVIVFVFLLRISNRLHEISEPSKSLKRFPELPEKKKDRLDDTMEKMDHRLRSAQFEQEKARNRMRNEPTAVKGGRPFDDRKNQQRPGPRPPFVPQKRNPPTLSQPPVMQKPKPEFSPPPVVLKPKVELSQPPLQPLPERVPQPPVRTAQPPVLNKAPDNPGNEMTHGRRMQIKRRDLEEEQKKQENQAPEIAGPKILPEAVAETVPTAENSPDKTVSV
jgi:hypothetical protein